MILNKPKIDRRSRHRAKHEKSNVGLIIVLIALGAAALVCFVAVTVIIVTIVLKKKRRKKEEAEKTKKVLIAKKPRKMESANINAMKFTHGGALVLDAKLQGPVAHAEESEGASIHTLQFDPHLNEIVDIGSNIEILPDTGETTATEMATVQNENKTLMTLRKAMHRTFAAGRKANSRGPRGRRTPGKKPSTPLLRSQPGRNPQNN